MNDTRCITTYLYTLYKKYSHTLQQDKYKHTIIHSLCLVVNVKCSLKAVIVTQKYSHALVNELCHNTRTTWFIRICMELSIYNLVYWIIVSRVRTKFIFLTFSRAQPPIYKNTTATSFQRQRHAKTLR